MRTSENRKQLRAPWPHLLFLDEFAIYAKTSGISLDTLLAQGYRYSWNGAPQDFRNRTDFVNQRVVIGVPAVSAPLLVEKCTEHQANPWTTTETTHSGTCSYCKTEISEETHSYGEGSGVCTVCGYSTAHRAFFVYRAQAEAGLRV